MSKNKLLKLLVEEIHSAVVATIGADGHPQTRVIDMMLYDEKGVYFLTARGKSFYSQLKEQGFIALSATKGKISVSLRGRVENIGTQKIGEIFEKNDYMKSIYPEGTRDALEVFRIYEADGEFFDISDPSKVTRESFAIGKSEAVSGYFVGNDCNGCKLCYSACPQKCIDVSQKPVVIDHNHCLSCGRCAEICPKQAIRRY